MNTSALDRAEQQVIRRALTYWTEHWDWECPTLFGIEAAELAAVLHAWPAPTAGAETTALAVVGALRELLYGASAVPESEIPALLGISYTDAEQLTRKALLLAKPTLD